MWGVDDFEDVLASHEAESCGGGLEVVDGLSHVPLGAEY